MKPCADTFLLHLLTNVHCHFNWCHSHFGTAAVIELFATVDNSNNTSGQSFKTFSAFVFSSSKKGRETCRCDCIQHLWLLQGYKLAAVFIIKATEMCDSHVWMHSECFMGIQCRAPENQCFHFFFIPQMFFPVDNIFTPWQGCLTAIEICIFAENSHAWFSENSPESLLTGWLRSRVKRGLMFSVFSPLLWAWKNSHIKLYSKLIYGNKCWPPLLLFVFKSHNLINPSV